MSILDKQRDLKKKLKLNPEIEMNDFIKEQKAILAIDGTEWFKAVMRFWKKKSEDYNNILKNIDPKNTYGIAKAQAGCEIADSFIKFIKSRTN